MKCEKCGKNEATTYYKESINGKTRELHLCADCTREMNVGGAFQHAFANMTTSFADAGFDSFFGDPFHSLLGGGFGTLWNDFEGALPTAAGLLGAERRCPTCGMTESALRRTGRAGCPDCYHAFEDLLNPYIKQVHGADSHIGSSPTSGTAQNTEKAQENPVDGLKSKLQEAIGSENFEEAARLRDEIRRLEGEGK